MAEVPKGGMPGEENLVTRQHVLEIEHVPTGHKVKFAAFLENFSDAYNSEWVSEQVYGRMDPIATFQNTRRAIAVSWKVPAASELQAVENLKNIGKLMQFLYPLYQTTAGKSQGTVINMGPLVRVKFGNLIMNSEDGTGLLGYLNGFTTDIGVEDGIFMQDKGFDGKPAYFPKTVTLNFEMNVIHEHSVGWKGTKDSYTFRGGTEKGFPYGSLKGTTAAAIKENMGAAGALAQHSLAHRKGDAADLKRQLLGPQTQSSLPSSDPNGPAGRGAGRILLPTTNPKAATKTQ